MRFSAGMIGSTPAGVVMAAVEYSVVQVCVHRFEFLNKNADAAAAESIPAHLPRPQGEGGTDGVVHWLHEL